jgi:hypothetical protein
MRKAKEKREAMNPLTAWGLAVLLLSLIWFGGSTTIIDFATKQNRHLSQTLSLVEKQQALLASRQTVETALEKALSEKKGITYLIDPQTKNPATIFQSLVRDLAKNTGISLTKIKAPQIQKNKHLTLLTMQFESMGSINNIRDFLIRAASFKPIIRVDNLNLISVSTDASDANLNISMQVSSLMDKSK